jgi:hypothetical protein
MKPTVGDLERVVDEYLGGRHEFWAFYHAFMDTWIEAELGDEDIDRWDEAYEIVYMAVPDPVAPDDRDVGIIGEGELKSRLSEFRERIAW